MNTTKTKKIDDTIILNPTIDSPAAAGFKADLLDTESTWELGNILTNGAVSHATSFIYGEGKNGSLVKVPEARREYIGEELLARLSHIVLSNKYDIHQINSVLTCLPEVLTHLSPENVDRWLAQSLSSNGPHFSLENDAAYCYLLESEIAGHRDDSHALARETNTYRRRSFRRGISAVISGVSLAAVLSMGSYFHLDSVDTLERSERELGISIDSLEYEMQLLRSENAGLQTAVETYQSQIALIDQDGGQIVAHPEDVFIYYNDKPTPLSQVLSSAAINTAQLISEQNIGRAAAQAEFTAAAAEFTLESNRYQAETSRLQTALTQSESALAQSEDASADTASNLVDTTNALNLVNSELQQNHSYLESCQSQLSQLQQPEAAAYTQMSDLIANEADDRQIALFVRDYILSQHDGSMEFNIGTPYHVATRILLTEMGATELTPGVIIRVTDALNYYHFFAEGTDFDGALNVNIPRPGE